MNLQLTFDPNNIASVDQALDLIERLHPTVLTDRARSKERRAAEQAALAEIASRGCTCTGTGGRHEAANMACPSYGISGSAQSWPQVGPHSRACGMALHPHGAACHSNCPTCHGDDYTPPTDL